MYHNYPTKRHHTKDLEGGIYDFVKDVGQQIFGTNVDNPDKVNNYQPTQLPPKKTLYDMIWNTYNPNSMRTIPGWSIIKQTSTLIFYLQNNSIVVAIRGSTDWRDVAADIRISLNVLFSSARFTKDLETLKQVQIQYPPTQYTYYGVAHSLGGAILQRFLKMGLISEGLSYNPAIEKSEINDTTTKHYKVYNEDDPLFMLMGKNASNVEVRPNKKSGLAKAGHEVLKQFSLGRAVNSLQAHLLGNFEGGKINRHFPINYGLDTDDYLEKAKDYARKSGYEDYASLKYADDGTHKLILRGVPFGNKDYKDFISYSMDDGKEVAKKHRDSYLKRATKIKGNWKDDPYSPNNLAIRILWGGGRKKSIKASTVSKPVDWEDIKWGSFTNQYKVWKIRHPEYTHINSLDDFARMILEAPQAFKPITLKRARFYLNVLKPQHRPQDLDLEGSGLVDDFVEFLRKIIGNKQTQPTGSFQSYDSYDKKAWEKRQKGRREGTYDAFGSRVGGGLFDLIQSGQNWVLGKALEGVNIAEDFTKKQIVKPLLDKLNEKLEEVRNLPAVQQARDKIIQKAKELLL